MKTHNYFITGMPRSGTAWIANFLTWGNSLCHHELLIDCNSFGRFHYRMSGAGFVGDSDTALALIMPWMIDHYPVAKYIFINRDRHAVERSLAKIGKGTGNLDEIQRSIEWASKYVDHMFIDFENLFTDTKTIWDFIGLGDFPYERHLMLQKMKIDDSPRFIGEDTINLISFMRETNMEDAKWQQQQ